MNQSSNSTLYFKRLLSRKNYNKNSTKYPDVTINKVNDFISKTEKEIFKPKDIFNTGESSLTKEVIFNSKKLRALIVIPQIGTAAYFLISPWREFCSERINYTFIESYKLFSLISLSAVSLILIYYSLEYLQVVWLKQ